MLSQLLLALLVGAALSPLGLPAFPFARRRRGAVPLGTRWALFGWSHPRAARALFWAALAAAAALAAWVGWPWVSRPEPWSEAGARIAAVWAAASAEAVRLFHRP